MDGKMTSTPFEERFVRRRVGEEDIWLDLLTGRIYGVNGTGGFVLEAWREGARTLEALVARVTERYDVSEEDAGAAVSAFLAEVGDTGLLAPAAQPP